jgi:WD40 repeat protein
MPDAFFSYSRRDGDFVRRLARALQERGKEVWVDVDGIRDTERFPEALRRAIEASDAFVFVISPDSVSSEFCEQEVAHAAGLNKRIVPLALRQVPDTELPEEIRFRNWIPVDGEGPFEAGVERVVAALETDLEWERQHTRLTVKALEWDAAGRDRSFLLRGADLKAAERWLAAGADKDPGPTALEQEYLVAARQSATRRQRALVGGSVAVAVVAIGLLIFALISRSAAVDQALTSDAERVGGQALSEKNLGLAMLYAVAGVKLQNRLQTRSDLLTVLQNNPAAIKVIRPSQEQVTALAVNARGQLLATGDSAGVVRFEDMSRWKRSGGALHLGGAIAKNAMSFSPRGDTLVVLTQPGPRAGTPTGGKAGREKLYAIDVATRKVRLLDSWGGAFGGLFQPRASLAYDPGGRHIALALATTSSSGVIAAETLRLLDASSGRAVWQRPYPCCFNQQTSPVVGFAAHGALLTSAQQSDTLLWNPHTGRVVRRFSIGGQPAISADGTRVALAINSPTLFTPTSRVAVLDLRTGRSRYLQAALPTNWLATLAFTPDGSRIVGDTLGGDVYVWDPSSGGIAQTIAATREGSEGVALLDPTGRTLLVGLDDGSVLAWDMTGKRQLGRAFHWDIPTQSCAFSPCLAVNHRSDLMATDEGDGSVAWSICGPSGESGRSQLTTRPPTARRPARGAGPWRSYRTVIPSSRGATPDI